MLPADVSSGGVRGGLEPHRQGVAAARGLGLRGGPPGAGGLSCAAGGAVPFVPTDRWSGELRGVGGVEERGEQVAVGLEAGGDVRGEEGELTG